jgi:hypothetical protein
LSLLDGELHWHHSTDDNLASATLAAEETSQPGSYNNISSIRNKKQKKAAAAATTTATAATTNAEAATHTTTPPSTSTRSAVALNLRKFPLKITHAVLLTTMLRAILHRVGAYSSILLAEALKFHISSASATLLLRVCVLFIRGLCVPLEELENRKHNNKNKNNSKNNNCKNNKDGKKRQLEVEDADDGESTLLLLGGESGSSSTVAIMPIVSYLGVNDDKHVKRAVVWAEVRKW